MRASLRHRILGLAGCCVIAVTGGCSVGHLARAERMKDGLVLVLPGIEGRSKYNTDIARGLDEGGVPCAIEIYDWGTTVPLGGLVNLMALKRNQRVAQQIAERILDYQAEYPGRPVHLVGHSGGGGLTILVLEALPPRAEIASAILLAAAISPDHDLSLALSRTRRGIWNFYSKADIGYLRVGTGLFGTIDRKHTQAAGAVGFRRPTSGPEWKLKAYEKLRSVRYRGSMRPAGNRGTHTGWADREFVALWLAPVVLATGDARAGYQITFDDRYNPKPGTSLPEPPTRGVRAAPLGPPAPEPAPNATP